jgi:hypothetical protein
MQLGLEILPKMLRRLLLLLFFLLSVFFVTYITCKWYKIKIVAKIATKNYLAEG